MAASSAARASGNDSGTNAVGDGEEGEAAASGAGDASSCRPVLVVSVGCGPATDSPGTDSSTGDADGASAIGGEAGSCVGSAVTGASGVTSSTMGSGAVARSACKGGGCGCNCGSSTGGITAVAAGWRASTDGARFFDNEGASRMLPRTGCSLFNDGGGGGATATASEVCARRFGTKSGPGSGMAGGSGSSTRSASGAGAGAGTGAAGYVGGGAGVGGLSASASSEALQPGSVGNSGWGEPPGVLGTGANFVFLRTGSKVDSGGAVMVVPHFGHWSVTPAISGGTASLVPQWWQANLMRRDFKTGIEREIQLFQLSEKPKESSGEKGSRQERYRF